jgi:hypothetical protein
MKYGPLFILVLTCLVSPAQVSKPTEVFKSASAQKIDNEDIIAFTVASEVNIRNYILEGSNDGSTFEFLRCFPSRGNSMIPVNYEITVRGTSFAHYRVRQTDMNTSDTLSDVMSVKQTPTIKTPNALSANSGVEVTVVTY